MPLRFEARVHHLSDHALVDAQVRLTMARWHSGQDGVGRVSLEFTGARVVHRCACRVAGSVRGCVASCHGDARAAAAVGGGGPWRRRALDVTRSHYCAACASRSSQRLTPLPFQSWKSPTRRHSSPFCSTPTPWCTTSWRAARCTSTCGWITTARRTHCPTSSEITSRSSSPYSGPPPRQVLHRSRHLIVRHPCGTPCSGHVQRSHAPPRNAYVTCSRNC